jgi:chromosome segregation ATPase
MLAQIVSEKNKVADYQQRPSDDAATLRRMIGQLTSTIAELDAKPLPGMNRDADATGRDRELRAEKDKLLSRLEKMNASAHEAEKLSSGINKDILDLEKKVIDAQSSLKRKRERKNVLSLIPERSGTKKEPILVLVQSSLIRYQRADGTPGGSGSVNELINYLRQSTPATHYVVFYFKPSGSPHFEMLTKRARQEGYEIGYDVIPEDMDVEFSNEASVKP